MMRKFLVSVALLAWLGAGLPARAAVNPNFPQSDEPKAQIGSAVVLGGDLKDAQTVSESNVPAQAAFGLGPIGTVFRSAGQIGVSGLPYEPNPLYLNQPSGLQIHGDQLLVVESRGAVVNRFQLDLMGGSLPVGYLQRYGQVGVNLTEGIGLVNPKAAVMDSQGVVFITQEHGVKGFNSTGELVLTAANDTDWLPGTDPGQFDHPSGILALGDVLNGGSLLVVDTGNNRIKVLSNWQNPNGMYYPLTQAILQNDEFSDQALFNQPSGLAWDGSGGLLVLDRGNYRVLRCTSSTNWATTSCLTYFGGAHGVDPLAGELGWAEGIAVDTSTGSEVVYLADREFRHVLRCSGEPAVCTEFIAGGLQSSLGEPVGVAVDRNGSVYVSDAVHMTVSVYDSSGVLLGVAAGSADQPYQPAPDTLNTPWGVALDAQGNFYILEEQGYTLQKRDAAGNLLWRVGQPGLEYHPGRDFSRDETLGSAQEGLIGRPGLDALGRVFVPDAGNARVQIFAQSDGALLGSLGVAGNPGADNSRFNLPSGVAVHQRNGDVYVADRGNHRIQIFNSQLLYRATIGISAQAGSDAQHFNLPTDVWVDGAGVVYVADSGNRRVQRCLPGSGGFSCTTFVGNPDWQAQSFDVLQPLAVMGDGEGRIYIANDLTSRVEVFDSRGNYLTSLGGWGTGHSQLRGVGAVAIGSDGSVWVADRQNHRLLRYIFGYPEWNQISINGFGSPGRTVMAVGEFAGRLYAGLEGTDLLYRLNGNTWEVLVSDGFGQAGFTAVEQLFPYQTHLYAGVYVRDALGVVQFWRSPSGDRGSWERVVMEQSEETQRRWVSAYTADGTQLYAATEGGTPRLYRSASGDEGSWTRLTDAGFEAQTNQRISSLVFAGGDAYLSTQNTGSGSQIWRVPAGGQPWEQINQSGFGLQGNGDASLQVLGGWLMASAYRVVDEWSNTWQPVLLRCALPCAAGASWTQLSLPAGMLADNEYYLLKRMGNDLAALSRNRVSGMEVWLTADGSNWRQMASNGFGDAHNGLAYEGNVFFTAEGLLLVATSNRANGDEIWLSLANRGFLPVLLR